MSNLTRRLILLVLSLFVALLVCVGTVMAWYSTTTVNTVRGIQVTVGTDEENITIEEVSAQYVNSAYLLSPGKSVTLSLSVDNNCTSFGVKLEASSSLNALANRYDIMTGTYTVARTLIGSDDLVYESFDIDKYLSSLSLALTTEQILEQKQAFYQRFRADNSLHSVMQVKVIELNGVACDVELFKQADSPIYYAQTPLALLQGDNLVVRLTYVNDVYMPTVTYQTDDVGAQYFAPIEATTYAMQNYNCFIGYSVAVTFVSE